MTERHPLTDFEKRILQNIQDHGCMVLSVFDREGKEPDFSCSIGFPKTASQPEVIVFSLPKALRANMINEIWRQCTSEGLKLADGKQISGLIEGFECISRLITSPQAISEHLGSAIWYHRRIRDSEVTEAYQIVWPGAHQGLFPWENGCVQAVIDDQPALYNLSVH